MSPNLCLQSVQRHRTLVQYFANADPDVTWDCVKTPSSRHLAKTEPRILRKQPSFALDADLIDKPQLLCYTGYIDGPLWVAIGVTNGMQPRNYPETEEKGLKLSGQDFARGGEVDT